MKKLLSILLFLVFSNHVFAQELFLYEFDKNVSLHFPEDADVLEYKGEEFIKGIIGNGIVILRKTNLGHDLLPNKERSFDKLCQGTKQGMLNKIKGKAIEEEVLKIGSVQVFRLVILMEVENEIKKSELYTFMREDYTYMLNFLSAEKGSDEFNTIKSQIIKSIVIND